MEGSQSPARGRFGLLRRVPIKGWVVLTLLAVGGIGAAAGGASGESALGALKVGDCLTAGAEPETVDCGASDAAVRVTEVFEGVTSGTMASLGCPAGSHVLEQRGLLDDDDDLAERAACAQPLR